MSDAMRIFFDMDLLACMDWLTPLLSLLDGSVETVSLNQDEIWAADELKRRGVKVRRLMTVPFDRIAFDVPVEQVQLAALLLRQMGIDAQDGRGRPRHRKAGKADKGGLSAEFIKALRDL